MVFYSKKTSVSSKDLEKGYGQIWVWTAIDAVSRLIVAYFVGDRTLEDGHRFIKDLVSRLETKPLFISDELGHYQVALLDVYHSVETSKLKDGIGRPYISRKVVDPDLDYAVVHKTRKNRRIIRVEKKVIYGDADRIESRLKASGVRAINTSYVERLNATLRQHDSHLHRKSYCFAKAKYMFQNKLAIVIAYYNFVKPHITLSRNPDKTTTKRTPAQVAGITEAPWTVGYLLARPEICQ